jgi:hypothetical protein
MIPGVKTTEFWLTLVAVIVGAVLSSGLLIPASDWFRFATFLTTVLAGFGYTAQRTALKGEALRAGRR